MAEISGAISSVSVAAESAVTTAVTATAERAAQTAAAATETAAGVIPDAVEAVPEVIDAGVEKAAQEGLAAGAETALETSGPDAALNQIAEAPTEVNTVSLDLAQADVSTEQGAPVSTAEQTTVQADSGISEEIRNDPDFKQKLEEERAVAQETGEPIDEKELSQRALDKFNQDKQAEQQQLTPEQQRLQQLEERINGLVAENAELRNNVAQINESLGQIKDVLTLLTKTVTEQDPKKKESLLAMIAKILAVIVIGSVVEGGKTVAPPLSSSGT